MKNPDHVIFGPGPGNHGPWFSFSGEIQEGDSEALVEDFEKYALNYDYNDLVSIDDGAEEPGTYE